MHDSVVMKSAARSMRLRVVGLESTVLAPSSRKSVRQNGSTSKNDSVRGIPTTGPEAGSGT